MDDSPTIKALIVPHLWNLLSLREAAGLMRMPYNTVQEKALRGEIPGAWKVGNQWRVRAWEFEAWRLGLWMPEVEAWTRWATRHGIVEPVAC